MAQKRGDFSPCRACQLRKNPLEPHTKANIFTRYIYEVGFLQYSSSVELETLWKQDYGLSKRFFAENFVMQELRAVHNQQIDILYAWSEGKPQIEVVRIYQGPVIPMKVKAAYRS